MHRRSEVKTVGVQFGQIVELVYEVETSGWREFGILMSGRLYVGLRTLSNIQEAHAKRGTDVHFSHTRPPQFQCQEETVRSCLFPIVIYGTATTEQLHHFDSSSPRSGSPLQ